MTCTIICVVFLMTPCRTALAKLMPATDEAVALRLKFEKGKDFYVETVTTAKQKKVMDHEQTYVHHWQPERMLENGDWIVRVRAVRIIMKTDIGGNRINYDSSNPPARSPGFDFFESLLKAEFTIIVQPDGGIRKVEGGDKLLQEIARAPSGTSSLMQSVLSEDVLKTRFAPTAYLPAVAVASGATWTRKETLDLGPIGRYVTTYNYTYHAAGGCGHEIRFKSSSKYTPPGKDDARLPFVIKSAELNYELGDGKIVFDAERGRLRELSHTMRLTGTMLIEMRNQETRVLIELTQTVRVRTMDTYSLPPKK